MGGGKDAITYCKCVVNVNWNAGASVPNWNVNAYRRDDNRWNAGNQVFASNS